MIKRKKITNRNKKYDLTKPFFFWNDFPTDKQVSDVEDKLPKGYKLRSNEDGWFAVLEDDTIRTEMFYADPNVPDILKHIRWNQGQVYTQFKINDNSVHVIDGTEGGFGLPLITHTPGGNPLFHSNVFKGSCYAVRDGLAFDQWGKMNIEAAINGKVFDGRSLVQYQGGSILPGNPLYVDNETGAYIGVGAIKWEKTTPPKPWIK